MGNKGIGIAGRGIREKRRFNIPIGSEMDSFRVLFRRVRKEMNGNYKTP